MNEFVNEKKNFGPELNTTNSGASSVMDPIGQVVASVVASVQDQAGVGGLALILTEPGMGAVSATLGALKKAGQQPVFYRPNEGYASLSIEDARSSLSNLTREEGRVLVVEALQTFSSEEQTRFHDTVLANRGRWAVVAFVSGPDIADMAATKRTMVLFEQVAQVTRNKQKVLSEAEFDRFFSMENPRRKNVEASSGGSVDRALIASRLVERRATNGAGTSSFVAPPKP